MLMHPFATLRHLFSRLSSPEQVEDSKPKNDQADQQPPELRPSARPDTPPERHSNAHETLAAPGLDQGQPRSAQLARLMATYVGVRAEEMLELLFEAISRDMDDQVARTMQATREALSAEIASIRDSASTTQRETSRMGRELVRTGAAVEGVQASLIEVSAAMQRLEVTLQTERERARDREQEAREEARLEALDEILATLDGLEAALDEARVIAQALAEVGRQIDDPTVRRWWRAMGEATGTKRPLPAMPVSDVETWGRGLELTYRRLRDALQRRGVTAIEAAGRPFDPHLHEAVAVMPCPPEQDGIVIREERRGYRTVERVVRLAQVVVGKAEPPAQKSSRPRRKSATAGADEPGGIGSVDEEVANE